MNTPDVIEQPEPPTAVRSSDWLCRIGWHTWSKWQMGECTTTSIFYKGERGGLCQIRKCQKCGKTQVEQM